jgi:hypothetical protein
MQQQKQHTLRPLLQLFVTKIQAKKLRPSNGGSFFVPIFYIHKKSAMLFTYIFAKYIIWNQIRNQHAIQLIIVKFNEES